MSEYFASVISTMNQQQPQWQVKTRINALAMPVN
jgi:hypothetical protein